MSEPIHVLINGLSMGTGGGYTVGRELLRSLALARPQWTFTFAAISGLSLHEQMRNEALPGNCRLLWAPAITRSRIRRSSWERREMARYARDQRVGAVLQLNGLVVPGIGVPTLSHNQDPWPYRPEAWSGARERMLACLKRRAHGRALKAAAAVGWTSRYLEDLVCGFHHYRPRMSEVFYNGLPADWLARANQPPSWIGRPMRLVTVSNVEPYKRQDLVIRAMARIVHEPDVSGLQYFIVGQCSEAYRRELQHLAASLGVGDRVVVEGRVSDARVRELLASSRCFVLMSVCESFGIPAIEAMSYGTPVVTSRCCAMPEVCGDAADLCTPDQLDELAGALKRALTDAEHALVLRARGAQRVQQFEWRTTAERVAQRLEQLATSKDSPALRADRITPGQESRGTALPYS